MFRTLVISQKKKWSSWSWLLMFSSLAIHGMLLGYFGIRGLLTIPSTLPPAVTVSFLSTRPYYRPIPPVQPVRKSGAGRTKQQTIQPKRQQIEKPKKWFEPTDIPSDISLDILDQDEMFNQVGIGSDEGVEHGLTGEGLDVSDWGVLPEHEPVFIPFRSGMVKPRKLRGPQPEYPELARLAGMTCSVKLEAKINVEGEVVDLTILETCPVFADEFNKAVFNAVKQWKFAPATEQGIPVPVRYILTIRFEV
ncbi:TonB family protein [bacterium]|nr:TonB family protein [bacterium]